MAVGTGILLGTWSLPIFLGEVDYLLLLQADRVYKFHQLLEGLARLRCRRMRNGEELFCPPDFIARQYNSHRHGRGPNRSDQIIGNILSFSTGDCLELLCNASLLCSASLLLLIRGPKHSSKDDLRDTES